ncbi:MAG: hypothetical protein IH606_18550 [Burkholderiales bacterium]|nr:hypothetical protein [Burkholderiales bacterium]
MRFHCPGAGVAAEELGIKVRAHQNLDVRERARRQRIALAQHRIDPYAHRRSASKQCVAGLARREMSD